MSAIDFGAWVAPDLVLTVGGREFRVSPPTVEDAKLILACAVYGEVKLGLVKGEVPAEIAALIDQIGPDEHPALREAWPEMVAAGVPKQTIDRMAYYAVFFWARGREYADMLATILWTPRDVPAEAGEAAPKARRRSPRKSGRSTASATPSTPT